jgi:signal transduction histidine kinase
VRICLVSQDQKLRELLREVVGQSLMASAPGAERPKADLYVWDVETVCHLPEACAFAADRHLFLVERQDLAVLGRQVQSQFGCILLKPVNRATLEAFLTPSGEERAEDSLASNKSTNAMLSERDLLLKYVLETNLKLQEYDQDRTNFLSRAIHDLRAPLTALHGYSGLLLDGELGPINSKQAELLRRMRSSTERMATLARSLLALSVEGHVQRNLQLEQGDLEACVSQALEDLSTSLDEKQISVDAQFDPPEQPFFFDPQQIEQVLMNLIENACRFTPKRGGINVRGYSIFWDSEAPGLDNSAAAPNAYRIDVQDSGPGVDPTLSDRIFEQYTSYASGHDRSCAGLGLAICKLIVTAHGGRIWVDTFKPGALFSFVLPFEPKIAMARRAPGSEVLEASDDLKIAASVL